MGITLLPPLPVSAEFLRSVNVNANFLLDSLV